MCQVPCFYPKVHKKGLSSLTTQVRPLTQGERSVPTFFLQMLVQYPTNVTKNSWDASLNKRVGVLHSDF